jgi:hypothetical protein
MSSAQSNELTLADLVLRQTFGKRRHRGKADVFVRAPLLAATLHSALSLTITVSNIQRRSVMSKAKREQSINTKPAIPLAAMWGVIEYLGEDECQHYAGGRERDHVFQHVRKLAQYLTKFPNRYSSDARECLSHWRHELRD